MFGFLEQMWEFFTHINKLGREFEGRCLKAQVFRGAGEDEAEVDVDDVSFRVQQDVAVVSAGRTDGHFAHVSLGTPLFLQACF